MLVRRSFVLSFCTLWCACALAQDPNETIRRIVDAEYSAYQSDHSDLVYLQEMRQSGHHIVQWVVRTDQGEVRRPLEQDDRPVSDSKERELIQHFLRNPDGRKKQLAEIRHDQEQVFELLRLLPAAFVWKQTSASATTICLHFEPSPQFHPSTREARIFSGMIGELVADSHQYRVLSVRGHLIHDISFGGGILGKLQEGGSFYIEQEQIGASLWQVSAIHVHVRGTALLFKSVALEEEDDRSSFEALPSGMTLDEAAEAVMKRPSSGLAMAKPGQ
jgi:hypothetical protein